MPRKARAGDGWLACPTITGSVLDSNQVISLAAILGGIYQRTNIASARTDTTVAATVILAALPSMGVGDNFMLLVSNGGAAILTVAGGTGVTVSGLSTVAVSGSRWYCLTKTSETTMTCVGL